MRAEPRSSQAAAPSRIGASLGVDAGPIKVTNIGLMALLAETIRNVRSANATTKFAFAFEAAWNE